LLLPHSTVYERKARSGAWPRSSPTTSSSSVGGRGPVLLWPHRETDHDTVRPWLQNAGAQNEEEAERRGANREQECSWVRHGCLLYARRGAVFCDDDRLARLTVNGRWSRASSWARRGRFSLPGTSQPNPDKHRCADNRDRRVHGLPLSARSDPGTPVLSRSRLPGRFDWTTVLVQPLVSGSPLGGGRATR
jgi:hypothetical protein